jgi:hypothetical protein
VDASVDRYLRRIDGLEAQIWARPSRGQLFWLRHLPALFASDPQASGRLARWWAGACPVRLWRRRSMRWPTSSIRSARQTVAPSWRCWGSPVTWMLLGSLLQAGSHALEPLPPRVSRSRYWVPVREYVLGPPGSRHRAGQVLRRCAHLAAQAVFGTIDELVASPRLLPVLLLDWLWRAGHRPQQSASYRGMAAAAIASGNPAPDYIGTGGPTPLRGQRP